ncbi:phage tail tape measure protein [Anaerococcus jeddahensis]|uniref:phage tail tape measure protein n=1 Tax=Anaerococcus jeddahensis TaxID=1673719 RepID=UPI001FD84559|nr:phage tail tape measure protein [Anaerococcus jeddahensis]
MMPVSLAVAGLGVAAVKTASDFDSGMAKVKAVSGATGSDFDALREKAREMGAKTKFSASEAAEAMNYMAMAGWKSKDMISGIEGVMNLAAASGEDLATTSDIVTDALTAFGLKAEDSSHFADVLAAASSNANTNVSLMGETFKYAAPIAGTLGYSVEDTAVAIGLMANAGIKGSQAGTALRAGLTRLASPTKEVMNGMSMLGLSIEDVQGLSLDETLSTFRVAFANLDGTQKAQAASMIFGKNAMSGMLAIINASEKDYNSLSDAIYNADGTAEKMAATMQDNLAGQLKILQSALEELAISFGELLMPAVRKAVDILTKLVNGLNALPGPVKGIIAGIALFIAALGPVLMIVGKLIWSIGTIMTKGPLIVGGITKIVGIFTGTLIPAITAVVSAIGIVPIAIGAVIAGLVLLWKKCDWFREGVISIWETIKESTVAIWNGIKEFFANLWQGISESWTSTWTEITSFLSEFWTGFIEGVKTTWKGIKDFFANLWNGLAEGWNTIWTSITTFLTESWNTFIEGAKSLWQSLGEFFTSLWTGIQTTFTNIWTAISTTTTEVFTAVGEFIRITWEGVKTLISTVLDAIKVKVETIWNGLKEFLTTIITAIGEFISTSWTNIKTTIETILTSIKTVLESIWNGIKTFISSTMNNIKSFVSSGWNSIKSTISSAVNTAKSAVSSAFNSMRSSISSTMSNIQSTIRNGFNNAVNHIKNLASQAYTWGADMINGIARGIRSAISNVTSAVSNVASTIRSYLHFSVPDVGPLTDYESWMPDFMEGLSKGIEKSRRLVQSSMKNVASDMVLNPNISTVSMGGHDKESAINGIDIGRQISDALANINLKSENSGDIVIPVYLGGTLLDEVIVNASMRKNLRSGGR